MFMPERIDHHGWQLALLALQHGRHCRSEARSRRARARHHLGAVARDRARDDHLSRARRRRDGAVLGRRRARSAIGCAPMPCRSAAASRSAFCSSPPTTTATPVCDALSPVFLSDALLGGALMYGLAWLSPARLEAPAGARARRPARSSPASTRRLAAMPAEARAYLARSAAAVDELCEGGAAGLPPRLARRDADRAHFRSRARSDGPLLAWMRRRDPELLRRIIGVAAPGFAASLLLLWQTRTGPAAQMMAAVGAAALVWFLFPLFWLSKYSAVRVAGALAVIVVGAGAIVPFVLRLHSREQGRRRTKRRSAAPTTCAPRSGGFTRSRSSPRAWCSPSSILARG